MQSALADVSWLSKSFGRATIMSQIDGDEKERIYPVCWIADSKDQFEMIANDNWNAYSFFVCNGTEKPIDYSDTSANTYERDVSLYVWCNLSAIDDTKPISYIEHLKIDIKNAIQNTVYDVNYGAEILEVENDPLKVYEGFTINVHQKQLLYFPYQGFRIDMKFRYDDTTIC